MPRRRTSHALSVLVVLSTVLASGCSGTAEPAPDSPTATAPAPDGTPATAPDPTVTGTVAIDDAGSPVVVDTSDDYYDRMSLVAGGPDVRSSAGDPIALADLRDGDRVAVQIDEAAGCAESSPVQCTVLAVQVLR